MSVVLVTGGLDRKIMLWDAPTAACIRTIKFQDSQINCLGISYDKNLILGGGNPQLRVFDLNSNKDSPVFSFDGHTSNISAAGFFRENNLLFSSSEDGTLRLWDVRAGSSFLVCENGAGINSAVLCPSQLQIITGDQNGSVKLWNLQTGNCENDYVPDPETPIRSVCISMDGSLIAAGNTNSHIYVWKASRDSPSTHSPSVTVADSYGEAQSSYIGHIEYQSHDSYLLKCLFSPDLKYLVTTSADRSAKLWDTDGWKMERNLEFHQRWVWDASFSADGSYLVTASSDHTAILWDVRSGDHVQRYKGHGLAVTCVALNDSSGT